MWTQMANLAERQTVPLNVILNPNSGPGVGPIDADYLSVGGQNGPLVRLRQAGATIVGYVHTQYGERSWEQVRAEIDRYWDPAYWRGQGFLLDGLFVDEMSNDWARIPYYQRLRDYVREKQANVFIIGNPGTRFTTNSAGNDNLWTVDDYLATVDTMVVFEESSEAYRAAMRWPEWSQGGDSSRFAHIVHTELTEESMRATLALARQRHAGMVYLTDDLMPNPYDRLPSYWATEAKLVSIPESSAGACLVAPLVWGWRRGRRIRPRRSGNEPS